MRTRLSQPANRSARRAFSFVEMMVATVVFALVISAIVYTNMVGMTMMDNTRPKLDAETQSRRLLDQLVNDISSAKLVFVGDGDLATFAPVVADGAPRQGGALQLCPTLDTNTFILYYRDTADQTLRRASSGAVSGTLIAPGVTNSVVFTGEDYQGSPLTNSQQNMAIGIDLEFSQIGVGGTPIGTNNFFRAYRFQTRVARRTL
jgi:prepilin-type N-terminal cleavage/methylation domain-containing protein